MRLLLLVKFKKEIWGKDKSCKVRRRVGGGGIYSSAADLANFLIAHMSQGEFTGRQLLQPDTIAAMQT